jgi:hypothetical protein
MIKLNIKYFLIFEEIFLVKVLYFSDFVNLSNIIDDTIFIIWTTKDIIKLIIDFFLIYSVSNNKLSKKIITVAIIIIRKDIEKEMHLFFIFVNVGI